MSTLALTASEKAIIQAKYATPASALWARDAPRYGDSNDISKVTDGDMKYAIGVGIYMGVGILLAIMTMFYGLFFCCCHCCCHCCDPRASGYSEKNRNVSVGLAITFGVFMAAGGIAGLIMNSDAHTSFTDEKHGMVNIGTIVIDSANDMLTSFTTDLKSITDQVPATADSALVLVTSTRTLLNGRMDTLNSMIDQARILLASAKNISIPEYNVYYACTTCAELEDDANDVTAEVQRPGETIASVNSFLLDVEDTIIDAKEDIVDTIDDAFDNIDSVRVNIDDAGDTSDKYEKDLKNYENIIYAVTIALMLLPIVALIFVVIATLLKKESVFKCSWVFAYFFVALSWLLAGIYLPIGMALGDGCVYLEQNVEQDPSQFVTDAQAEKVLVSCLVDSSLAQALNLTDSLDFVNLDFPSLERPDLAFHWPEFDAWTYKVSNLNASVFGFSPSNVDNALSQLDTLTGQPAGHWTRNNINSLDPNDYPGQETQVQDAKTGVLTLIAAETKINQTVGYLKSNVTAIASYVNSFKGIYENAVNQTNALSNTVDVLIDDAKAFLNGAGCGALGDSYGTVKKALCTDVVTAFSGLGICYFVIAICGWFFIWFAFRSGNRMEHPIVVDNVDDYFAQLAKNQQGGIPESPPPDEAFPSRPDSGADQQNEHILTVSNRNTDDQPNLYPVIDNNMGTNEGLPPQEFERHTSLPGQPEDHPHDGITDSQRERDLEAMRIAMAEQEAQLAAHQAQLEALQRQQEEEERLRLAEDKGNAPLVELQPPHSSSSDALPPNGN